MNSSVLRSARIAKNYTQSDVAEKAHISRAGYTNIEKGNRQPSVKVAKRIADVLDIDWTVLFEEKNVSKTHVTSCSVG